MKTFAQNLKEHSDFIEKETAKIQSLRDRAKTALANGEPEKADEFLAQGEHCLEAAEKAIREFETNHNEELKKLEYVANLKQNES